ncbi:MAG: hypothetical protein EZS28_001717 [Streblomastix strix]|uniref:C2 domain-containing protein n=1 Tax=Streblomastix strix TaxID=222440 RepID=A0A5J4X8A7_9EUKA|nr:MAG: hypothetical protein EZS28_001717 [Streblomastix strix]
MSYAGQVYITVIKCSNVKNTDATGKADPYVKLTLGKTSKETKHQKNNLNPTYNEQFIFQYEPSSNTRVLTLELYDDDTLRKDTLIGTIQLAFEEYLNKKQKKVLPFSSAKGEHVGDGEFEILYDAPTAPKSSGKAAAPAPKGSGKAAPAPKKSGHK